MNAIIYLKKKEKADFAYFERLKYFHSLFSEYSVYPEKIKQLENTHFKLIFKTIVGN